MKEITDKRAVDYIIYSLYDVALGFSTPNVYNNLSNISIKGRNSAKGDLGATVVSPQVLEFLLKDKSFSSALENNKFIIKPILKGKEKEKAHYLSPEGKKEIKDKYNIVDKTNKYFGSREIELIKMEGQKPEMATLRVEIDGVPLNSLTQ